MAVILIGHSGAGKSMCIQALGLEARTADMDLCINMSRQYTKSELDSMIARVLFTCRLELLALSVRVDILRRIRELREAGSYITSDSTFVYLRTSDRKIHAERLAALPVIGAARSETNIRLVLESAEEFDQLFLGLSDTTLDIDQLNQNEVVDAVRLLLNRYLSELKLLSRGDYDQIARSIGGVHWATAGSRWPYHQQAAQWVRKLHLPSPRRVLEMGTMGVSVVHGSDTIDYDPTVNNTDWNVPGIKHTYLHDARVCPWPIERGQYDLFIALRVFHHLRPFQEECFREARRIASALILVVPSRTLHPRGIDEQQLIDWNGGIPPSDKHTFDGDAGTGYLFSENDA